MAFANQFILAVGLLLLLSVLASRVTHRIGAPLLLVFLVIGMLVGEDGPGGIQFDNFLSAHLLASLALAVILFDGGLRTRYSSFRTGLQPAAVLATVGVLVTAAITGFAAAWIFATDALHGLLIGAIVGSTDAAAVFYLLRAHGLHLNERVSSTLEIESGANDPMAVFLTLTLIEYIADGRQGLTPALLGDFAWQMGVGGLVGAGGGLLLSRLINRLNLGDSLYPLLALAGGIATYGLAAVLEGSGFLAAYLGGLLVGNSSRKSIHTIRQFHDGMAWLSQISLFLMLGLLVTPTALLPVLPGGLLTALVLVFVARPVAVMLCLWPFRFSLREKLFISWVGLRGAVPIVLGLYPLLSGLDYAATDFHIAFCVVLVSLVLQGWTVAPVARWLGIQLPPTSQGRRLAEFDVPGAIGEEIVAYEVVAGSRAVNMTPTLLPLPEGGRFFALVRAGKPVPGAEALPLQEGDHVYLMIGAGQHEALGELFGGVGAEASRKEHRFFGEFVLPGESRLGDLVEAYDFIHLPAKTAPSDNLAELFRREFGARVVVGDRLQLDELGLVARQVREGRVTQVGLKIPRHV
jgi:cell volume regulation protein A